MSIELDWKALARTVACLVETERCLGRVNLLDENSIIRFAAEYLHTAGCGTVAVEHPRKDVAGQIDLVCQSPRSKKIKLALEAKWIRSTEGVTRQWLKEIALDVFKLQHLSDKGCTRAILIAGLRKHMDSEVWERDVQTGSRKRRGLPIILPDTSRQIPDVMNLINCATSSRRWLTSCSNGFRKEIPKTYKARLASRYSIPIEGSNDMEPCKDEVEVAIWLCQRQQNWQTFDPKSQWR